MISAAVLLAAVLAAMFPAYLVDAIRAADAEKAERSKIKACALLGAVVFLALAVVNSV